MTNRLKNYTAEKSSSLLLSFLSLLLFVYLFPFSLFVYDYDYSHYKIRNRRNWKKEKGKEKCREKEDEVISPLSRSSLLLFLLSNLLSFRMTTLDTLISYTNLSSLSILSIFLSPFPFYLYTTANIKMLSVRTLVATTFVAGAFADCWDENKCIFHQYNGGQIAYSWDLRSLCNYGKGYQFSNTTNGEDYKSRSKLHANVYLSIHFHILYIQKRVSWPIARPIQFIFQRSS